jgi:hypothetical protein
MHWLSLRHVLFADDDDDGEGATDIDIDIDSLYKNHFFKRKEMGETCVHDYRPQAASTIVDLKSFHDSSRVALAIDHGSLTRPMLRTYAWIDRSLDRSIDLYKGRRSRIVVSGFAIRKGNLKIFLSNERTERNQRTHVSLFALHR